jgi:exodeoxyribonuclease VII large subunit
MRVEVAAARALRSRQEQLEQRRVAEQLDHLLGARFRGAAAALEQRRQRLTALSPDAVLARGYSITQDDESGRVVRSAAESAPGRAVRIRVASGQLRARVEEVRP